jgi:hypothetical protein
MNKNEENGKGEAWLRRLPWHGKWNHIAICPIILFHPLYDIPFFKSIHKSILFGSVKIQKLQHYRSSASQSPDFVIKKKITGLISTLLTNLWRKTICSKYISLCLLLQTSSVMKMERAPLSTKDSICEEEEMLKDIQPI